MTARPRLDVVGGAAPHPLHIGVLSVHTSPLDQPGTGDGGGLNVYVGEVARRLAERGHRVDVLTRRTSPDLPDRVDLAPRLSVVHLDAGPRHAIPKQALPSFLCGFSLQAARRGHDYDLLHSHYWLSGWVARRLARRLEIPVVHTFHTLGMMKNEALAPGERPEPPLRLVAERRLAADTDRVLALTCGEGRLLHRRLGLSGRRITVVPPGVDVDRFRPADPAGDEPDRGGRGHGPVTDPAVQQVLDRVGDRPMVLFVGRLQPLKGPDVAVRTLAALVERVPEVQLVVVGGASGDQATRTEPAALAGLATTLGVADAVHLLPAQPQDQLAVLYRHADVVHVPSRTETFGLVALEAQASATPVVASAVDGLHSVVRDGGTLVEGHDPGDHADAVATYLLDADRAAEAGRAGRARALGASWSSTVDRLEAVYREVVEQHDLDRADKVDVA